MVLKVKGLIFCLLIIHESPSFNVLSALTAINDGLRLERDVVSERIGRNNAYVGAEGKQRADEIGSDGDVVMEERFAVAHQFLALRRVERAVSEISQQTWRERLQRDAFRLQMRSGKRPEARCKPMARVEVRRSAEGGVERRQLRDAVDGEVAYFAVSTAFSHHIAVSADAA